MELGANTRRASCRSWILDRKKSRESNQPPRASDAPGERLPGTPLADPLSENVAPCDPLPEPGEGAGDSQVVEKAVTFIGKVRLLDARNRKQTSFG